MHLYRVSLDPKVKYSQIPARRWLVQSSVYCLIFKFAEPSRRYLYEYSDFSSRLILYKCVVRQIRNWTITIFTVILDPRQFIRDPRNALIRKSQSVHAQQMNFPWHASPKVPQANSKGARPYPTKPKVPLDFSFSSICNVFWSNGRLRTRTHALIFANWTCHQLNKQFSTQNLIGPI